MHFCRRRTHEAEHVEARSESLRIPIYRRRVECRVHCTDLVSSSHAVCIHSLVARIAAIVNSPNFGSSSSLSIACKYRSTGGMSNEATIFYKRLASLLSQKWDFPYSTTLCWLRCHLCYSLLRSSIQAIRGARSSIIFCSLFFHYFTHLYYFLPPFHYKLPLQKCTWISHLDVYACLFSRARFSLILFDRENAKITHPPPARSTRYTVFVNYLCMRWRITAPHINVIRLAAVHAALISAEATVRG